MKEPGDVNLTNWFWLVYMERSKAQTGSGERSNSSQQGWSLLCKTSSEDSCILFKN